jgi:PAP2 superfamily protein
VSHDLTAPPASGLFSDDARRWVCVRCRAQNELDADTCATCGTSLEALLAEPAGAGVERLRGISALGREIALLLGLFTLWRLVGSVSLLSETSAFDRGRWLWRLERALHLPSELTMQQQVLPHKLLVQTLNVFYLAAHIGGLAALLIWLYARHRAEYRHWRNVVVGFTGISLLVQFVSVAPPRLLTELGFVDTAHKYGQSAYDHLGRGLVDQLSSMPSVHVGWAIIGCLAVIRVSLSRWRWLAIAHPVVTCYAVVVTANHFWLDGLAAAALVVLVTRVLPLAARRIDGRPALPDEA